MLPTNPVTTRAVEAFLAQPSHAVLLTGPVGVGKGSLARTTVAQLLGADVTTIDTNPQVLLVTDQKSIGIDAVRSLQHFLRLKSTSHKSVTRIVLIEDAHRMTPEAQNAILKILEEPPLDTVLILTATSSQSLLPTIASRLQPIAVLQPTPEQLQSYFLNLGYNSAQISRVQNMSGGLPGLMRALLERNEEHPLWLAAQKARLILASSQFERLSQVEELTKQRELAIDTCTMLCQMASVALKNPALQPSAQKKWQSILTQSLQAAEDLQQYVQPKLVLTKLLTSF